MSYHSTDLAIFDENQWFYKDLYYFLMVSIVKFVQIWFFFDLIIISGFGSYQLLTFSEREVTYFFIEQHFVFFEKIIFRLSKSSFLWLPSPKTSLFAMFEGKEVTKIMILTVEKLFFRKKTKCCSITKYITSRSEKVRSWLLPKPESIIKSKKIRFRVRPQQKDKIWTKIIGFGVRISRIFMKCTHIRVIISQRLLGAW